MVSTNFYLTAFYPARMYIQIIAVIYLNKARLPRRIMVPTTAYRGINQKDYYTLGARNNLKSLLSLNCSKNTQTLPKEVRILKRKGLKYRSLAEELFKANMSIT